jgi:hypothetical protein
MKRIWLKNARFTLQESAGLACKRAFGSGMKIGEQSGK